MGGCQSTTDSQLDKQLAMDARADAAKIKLLLLGAGESGKSTIFKQMKILYGKATSEEDRKEAQIVIFTNILSSMRILVSESKKLGTFSEIQDTESAKGFENIDNLSFNAPITNADWNIVKALWNDPGIQATWKRRAEFQIVDSVKSYFDDLDRISAPDYLPTDQDILLARVRTSGVIKEEYIIDKKVFEMYDVGGQRNERKKWIHCFDSVTAVIFVAALSEYNQKLLEDTSTNRMTEALDLFEDTSASPFFRKSSFILFLNKKDLFEKKITETPISDSPMFSDYTGGNDYDKGVEYFLKQFQDRFSGKKVTLKDKNGDRKQPRRSNSGDRQLYHHCTCATDTNNVKVVFGVCKKVILENSLKDVGFM